MIVLLHELHFVKLAVKIMLMSK